MLLPRLLGSRRPLVVQTTLEAFVDFGQHVVHEEVGYFTDEDKFRHHFGSQTNYISYGHALFIIYGEMYYL